MNPVSAILTNLAACLCQQIAEDGLPPTCYCGVQVGDSVAIDYIGACEERDGMAWTRLALAYPSNQVGVPNTMLRNCGIGFGIEVEIGVMRTGPMWGDDGEPPDEATVLAASDLQVADMYAMLRAIDCCDSLTEHDYILQAYRPQMLGFALGGSFTILVGL